MFAKQNKSSEVGASGYLEGELAQDDVRLHFSSALPGIALIVHVHHVDLVDSALHNARHYVPRLHALVVGYITEHEPTFLVPAVVTIPGSACSAQQHFCAADIILHMLTRQEIKWE